MPAAGPVQLLQTIQGAMCSGRRVNHTLTKDETAGKEPASAPAVCALSLEETSSACSSIQGGRALPALSCKQCRGGGYSSTDASHRHRESCPVSVPPDTLASGEDTSPFPYFV